MAVPPHFAVVGIDIGTTYSTYAYAVLSTERKRKSNEKKEIITSRRWNAKGREGISRKAPTSLLIQNDGSIKAFGYEAEDLYWDGRELGNMSNYLLFQRIKLLLMENKPRFPQNLDWEIPATNGQMYSARHIFKLVIEYMAKAALEDLRKLTEEGEVNINSVSWLLTVPAIWDDINKAFMREAALAANIPGKNITLVLEPEAAAIWCLDEQNLFLRADMVFQTGALPVGTEFVLLDIGGCTIDVSAQKLVKNGRMELLLPPYGGEKGGTRVDAKFEHLLQNTFGEAVIKKFQDEVPYMYMELMREFEAQKRDEKEEIHLRLHPPLLEIYKNHTERSEVNIHVDPKRKFHIDQQRYRITISKALFEDLFEETTNCIKACLDKVSGHDRCKNIKLLIVVGGLAESEYVQKFIKTTHKDFHLIIPQESDLSVVKGAVKFGLDPEIVVRRISRYTYGIAVFKDFDESVHPQDKWIVRDGEKKCKDCFSVKYRIGEQVKVGDKREFTVFDTFVTKEKASSKHDPLRVDIYYTSEENPIFTTDEGCQKLCQLVLPPPEEGWPTEATATVSFEVARTELIATFVDKKRKAKHTCALEFN